MKIIGTTGSGVLIDATKEEIANLWGYNKANDVSASTFSIGTEIKVAECWQRLKYLTDNKTILQASADKLREIASHLEVINPVVEDALSANPKLQPQVRAVRMED